TALTPLPAVMVAMGGPALAIKPLEVGAVAAARPSVLEAQAAEALVARRMGTTEAIAMVASEGAAEQRALPPMAPMVGMVGVAGFQEVRRRQALTGPTGP